MQLPAFAALEILFRLERPFDSNFVHFDVQIYYNAAMNALSGQLPYRDFFFPYPPASLLFFIPPALAAADAFAYFRLFEIWVLILDWVALGATAFIAQRIGQSLNRTLLAYTLAIPAMGVIVWQRYDLAPAMLVVLAFAAWIARWNWVAWALLALGTLVKIYPVLLVPLFAIAEYRTDGARRLIAPAAIFSAIVALGFAPFFIMAFGETAQTFFSQTSRGFEIESVGATLIMAASWFGSPAQAAYRRRLNTWEADSPASGGLQIVFLVLEIAATLFVYWRFWRARQTDATVMIRYSVAVITLSLLTVKVFSAQFIVWLFPLALLVGKNKFNLIAILFLLAGMLTQIGFPFWWQDLKQAALFPTAALIVRDAAIVWMVFSVIGNSGIKEASSEPASSPLRGSSP